MTHLACTYESRESDQGGVTSGEKNDAECFKEKETADVPDVSEEIQKMLD